MAQTTPAKLDVNYIKNLARLDLTPAEIAKYQSQLGGILDYFARLDAVNTQGIEPTSHAFPLENVWQQDIAKPGLTPDEALMNAPQRKGNEFVVPRVVEE